MAVSCLPRLHQPTTNQDRHEASFKLRFRFPAIATHASLPTYTPHPFLTPPQPHHLIPNPIPCPAIKSCKGGAPSVAGSGAGTPHRTEILRHDPPTALCSGTKTAVFIYNRQYGSAKSRTSHPSSLFATKFPQLAGGGSHRGRSRRCGEHCARWSKLRAFKGNWFGRGSISSTGEKNLASPVPIA